jgi:septum formation protein
VLSGAAPAPSTTTPDRLVLASASPRRAVLLQQIGWPADLIDAPAVDEAVRQGELPRPHALRLALAKAAAVAPRHPGCYVIAADTVVACGRRILPKAETEAVARRCLQLLSGRRHRVFGGVVVIAPSGRRSARVVTTMVTMKRLSPAEIDAYIASGEWHGKAGAYAIQGRAAALISSVSGSYSNIVGLALFEACQMLTGLGYRRPA